MRLVAIRFMAFRPWQRSVSHGFALHRRFCQEWHSPQRSVKGIANHELQTMKRKP
jgi:hypothetical protein